MLRPDIFLRCGAGATLFPCQGVYLGDVIAGERKYCRLAAIGGVWVDEDGRARGLRLADDIGEIGHLASHLLRVHMDPEAVHR